MIMAAAALVIVGGGPASAPVVTPPAAAHAQLLEAYAVADIHKSRPTGIVAVNARQLGDPQFRPIADQLARVLIASGFNIVAPPDRFTQAIAIEYHVYSDTRGDLPGSKGFAGEARFPAYRRITVTAYDLADPENVGLIWRTALGEDGFLTDVHSTIPPLVAAGAAHYGEHLTRLAVADCDDQPELAGSHIASRPCGAARAILSAPHVLRRPQVIVEGEPPPPPAKSP